MFIVSPRAISAHTLDEHIHLGHGEGPVVNLLTEEFQRLDILRIILLLETEMGFDKKTTRTAGGVVYLIPGSGSRMYAINRATSRGV